MSRNASEAHKSQVFNILRFESDEIIRLPYVRHYNPHLDYLGNIPLHTHACLLWSIYRVNEIRKFGLQFGSVHSTLSGGGGGGVAATTHCDRQGCDRRGCNRYCSHQPKPTCGVRSQTPKALVIWCELVCGVFRLEISKDYAKKFTNSKIFWYLLKVS